MVPSLNGRKVSELSTKELIDLRRQLKEPNFGAIYGMHPLNEEAQKRIMLETEVVMELRSRTLNG